MNEHVDPGPEAAKPVPEIPQQKVPKELKKTLQARAEMQLQLAAIRGVAESAHKTAQMAMRAMRAMVEGQVQLARVDLEKKPALAIIKVPEGQGLDEEIGEMFRQILGCPLLELPKDFQLNLLRDEDLEKAGLQKKVRLVDAAGQELKGRT